eukprot:TRINITY_DN20284_c0_g1_i1.p1 TRINITY_DN20284_c0_g1~~TRINITY_DN20284_c0_g1_i1.p1  ORF type:complete len:433 (-),score=40.64 TRINITY_DN20284_c0_g1_i1:141-1439(-)
MPRSGRACYRELWRIVIGVTRVLSLGSSRAFGADLSPMYFVYTQDAGNEGCHSCNSIDFLAIRTAGTILLQVPARGEPNLRWNTTQQALAETVRFDPSTKWSMFTSMSRRIVTPSAFPALSSLNSTWWTTPIVIGLILVVILVSLQIHMALGGGSSTSPNACRGAPSSGSSSPHSFTSSQDDVLDVLKANRDISPASKEVSPFPMSRSLCPQLVVPWRCECALLTMPLVIQGFETETVTVSVKDAASVDLLTVAYSSGVSNDSVGDETVSAESVQGQWQGHAATPARSTLSISTSVARRPKRCLKIFAAASSSLLATAHERGQDGRALRLCDSSGQAYAELEDAGGGSFVLAMPRHQQVRFRVPEGGVGQLRATSQDSRLLAFVEPAIADDPHGARSIVVGPLFDAGLMVLCVFGIDWFQRLSVASPAVPAA